VITISTFVVDISKVEASLRDFPNVPVEAKIVSADLDVAKSSGAPIIRLEFEIYHPDVGTTTIRDVLPHNFPAKVRAFWMALNDFTPEQMQNQSKVEINPLELVGASMIVQLGERENPATGKIYKSVVSPWYYPLSRVDVLSLGREERPF
jgi:hypothetical protein